MSFDVRRVQPAEYRAAGRVDEDGYLADGLLHREDGEIDRDYERLLLDVGTRDREAEVLVAVDDLNVIGTVTWCPPESPWRELATRPDQGEFRMLVGGRGRPRPRRRRASSRRAWSEPDGADPGGAVVVAAADDGRPSPVRPLGFVRGPDSGPLAEAARPPVGADSARVRDQVTER